MIQFIEIFVLIILKNKIVKATQSDKNHKKSVILFCLLNHVNMVINYDVNMYID